MKLLPPDRVWHYGQKFPNYPALHYSNGWIVGTWAIGACYKNPNPLYGAYPHGYLDRVHSMFPDAERVLHVFSGGLTKAAADAALAKGQQALRKTASDCPRRNIELVDIKGPEDGRYPTWQGDVLNMPIEFTQKFDLVLADPPYSPADAEKYGTKMPNRRAVMQALHRVTKKGGSLVWLDTVWPQFRKEQWRAYGHIGFVRSTMHRVRMVSFFEAI